MLLARSGRWRGLIDCVYLRFLDDFSRWLDRVTSITRSVLGTLTKLVPWRGWRIVRRFPRMLLRYTSKTSFLVMRQLPLAAFASSKQSTSSSRQECHLRAPGIFAFCSQTNFVPRRRAKSCGLMAIRSCLAIIILLLCCLDIKKYLLGKQAQNKNFSSEGSPRVWKGRPNFVYFLKLMKTEVNS